MDRTDLKILDLLQHDATLSTAEVAEAVGLSTTPCWRRIQNLEKEGVITRRVALLDRDHLNVGMDAFVTIRTNQHNRRWLEAFASAVAAFPEVIELYRMSGDVDYLMRVVVPDIAAYDDFYQRLIRSIDLSDVSSSFAMERIKYTTVLPLKHAPRRIAR
ncbi:MAG: Lrp/AsnC family transcriptional regulator [Gammaproteobacteria bacterium]|nr:Lrp/AsnC family transcriptional regulator [Gammaproteobacteria bacterium]MYK82027.1 Lrp/AsnC family transcriptional regulator [Gammaproteobacteria bacterium]